MTLFGIRLASPRQVPRDTSVSAQETHLNARLSSWKEIAAYLRSGVRTVQRWEKAEGLPIHRHLHHTQASIYAFTSDIDEWRKRRSSAPAHRELAAEPAQVALAPLVGRGTELAQLQRLWTAALGGTRQVVFVSGTLGIGKTTLVRAFLDTLGSSWVIQGNCVKPYGTGEPYLPIIDGLTRLVRRSTDRRLVRGLLKYAPSWVTHIPDLRNRDPDITHSAPPSPDRMSRELVDAIEVLSHDKPVLMLLEDLHWADRSTIELIDRIARRYDGARLLVLGTHRLEDWGDSDRPLMRTRSELVARRLCTQFRVPPLSELEVSEFLGQRGAWTDRHDVARTVHQWTGGVPLFINILLDDLIDTKRLTLTNDAWTLAASLRKKTPPIAPTIRFLTDSRLQRLGPDEQTLLEAASVAGQSFFAAAVASALRVDATRAERVFEALASRHQFVERQTSDEALGDVVTAKYVFLHSVFQQVLYDRLPAGERADLHRDIGLFLEGVYRSGREDLAAELAMHFERSRDWQRAALYHEACAATALGRGANHEARCSALKALDQLENLPRGPDRDRQELSAQLKVCAAVSNLSTMGDPQVERAYGDALAICERISDEAQVVPALLGIARFHAVRGNVAMSAGLAERALTMSRAAVDPLLRVQALHHLAVACCNMGRFPEAHAYASEAATASCGISSEAALVTSGFHPRPAALTVQSWASWFLGHPDLARRSALEAVAVATELSHPQTLAFTKAYAAVTLERCGIRDQSQAWAETSLSLAKQYELAFAIVFAEGVLGWILGRRLPTGGIVALSRSIQLQASMGMNLWVPLMSAWLAENLLYAGDITKAAVAIDEGLKVSERLGITSYDAQLIGLRADVLAASARSATCAVDVRGDEAENLARQSYSIATAQHSRSLQLRAATRLVRLATTDARIDEACTLLSRVYASFSEGLDTPDLIAARALLDSVCTRITVT